MLSPFFELFLKNYGAVAETKNSAAAPVFGLENEKSVKETEHTENSVQRVQYECTQISEIQEIQNFSRETGFKRCKSSFWVLHLAMYFRMF